MSPSNIIRSNIAAAKDQESRVCLGLRNCRAVLKGIRRNNRRPVTGGVSEEDARVSTLNRFELAK